MFHINLRKSDSIILKEMLKHEQIYREKIIRNTGLSHTIVDLSISRMSPKLVNVMGISKEDKRKKLFSLTEEGKKIARMLAGI